MFTVTRMSENLLHIVLKIYDRRLQEDMTKTSSSVGISCSMTPVGHFQNTR
jgi:hypothetical protein